jgi:hypothetical protein
VRKTRLKKVRLPDGRKKVSGYVTRVDVRGESFGILAPSKDALLRLFAMTWPHIEVDQKKIRRYAVASVGRAT